MSVSIETERKFYVQDNDLRVLLEKNAERTQVLRQVYLTSTAGYAIRVRDTDGKYSLELKQSISFLSSTEFTQDLHPSVGEAYFQLNLPETSKVRYHTRFDGKLYHYDVFTGKLAGLCVAEYEGEDAESLLIPEGMLDITYNSVMRNANLAKLDKWPGLGIY